MTESGALVLNRPDGARRTALDAHTPEALVGAWIDDAIDHLARMEYTCALDVLDDNPEGIGRIGLRGCWGWPSRAPTT